MSKVLRVASGFLRQAAAAIRHGEAQVEQVVEVLRPGPLGMLAHKFSAAELAQAAEDVRRAEAKWRWEYSKRRRSEVTQQTADAG